MRASASRTGVGDTPRLRASASMLSRAPGPKVWFISMSTSTSWTSSTSGWRSVRRRPACVARTTSTRSSGPTGLHVLVGQGSIAAALVVRRSYRKSPIDYHLPGSYGSSHQGAGEADVAGESREATAAPTSGTGPRRAGALPARRAGYRSLTLALAVLRAGPPAIL